MWDGSFSGGEICMEDFRERDDMERWGVTVRMLVTEARFLKDIEVAVRGGTLIVEEGGF